jgi:hypothetical protein
MSRSPEMVTKANGGMPDATGRMSLLSITMGNVLGCAWGYGMMS